MTDLGDVKFITWGLGAIYKYQYNDNVWKLWCHDDISQNKMKIIDFRNGKNTDKIDLVYDFVSTLRECQTSYGGAHKTLALIQAGAGTAVAGAGVATANPAVAVAGGGAASHAAIELDAANLICDRAVNLFRAIDVPSEKYTK